ncbi:MAG TPA: CBS domain-containing protein [Dehalococcoidia bacterium]|nr:CBS domain-containing protein [Dehalococcoidia bacterium]
MSSGTPRDQTSREYAPRQESDPWEDADWIPSDAQVIFPEDELSELMLERPISSIALSEPASVDADDSVRHALFRMRQRHARALLVLDGGELVGILTDRDTVLSIDRPSDDGSGVKVREIMTPDPLTVRPDEPIGKAAQILCLDGVHHLPVVENGEVRGLIAQGPIMHAIIGVLLKAQD